MKKIFAFLSVVVLFVSCMKDSNMEQGMKISGNYAYDDSTGLSEQYFLFSQESFSDISFSHPLSYMDNCFWGYSKKDENINQQGDYFIRDGHLYVSGKTMGAIEIKADFLLYKGKKYSKVKSFNEAFYSSIVIPEGNSRTLTYEDKEYAVPFTVNRPIPAGELTVYTRESWLSFRLRMDDGILCLHASETKVNRDGTVVLKYTNANDVTLSVVQRPSTFIKLSDDQRTVSYSQSSQSLSYSIENPLSGSQLTVTSDVAWVKNITANSETVVFDVEENPSANSRSAKLTASYVGAADVVFPLTQNGATSAIVLTPASQSCTYTGGTFSFDFAITNPRQDVNVVVKSDASWITDVTVSGNTVSYKVAENNSSTQRSGTIRLTYGSYASRTFTVTQSYSASVITASPASQSCTYTGGTFSFDFAITNPRQDVNEVVKSDASWITDVTVSGNTVSYKVTENNSSTQRSGAIQLAYGRYASCAFTVIQSGKPVQSLSLDKSSLELYAGTSEQLAATADPSDAALSWSSSNTSVATVSSSGVVTGVARGIVTITVAATDGSGKSAACLVEVKQYVTGITLNNASLILDVGKTSALTATVSPSNANDKTLTWSSSDSSVAIVDQNGTVTAVSKGTATITATANDGGGRKATCAITVYSYVDLSSSASANCYIVSSAGGYKFKTVKGKFSFSVGSVSKAEVLWESFGNWTAPSKGDIISSVSYSDNYIAFATPSTLKNGNAVIAAKDASGNILWSWHIWVCKDFNPTKTAQTYANDAGMMMDRNLGATSATPGDVGALGLLYQWGRKDPFLSGNSISSHNRAAASTLSWPLAVSSDSNNGTIAYAVAHPTTFITMNSSNYDWCYTGSSSTDDTRWDSAKTIYDPCPPGWRVPGGGENGVWSEAVGSSSSFSNTWDSANKGMNFSGKFGSAFTIWYPAAGLLFGNDGHLGIVGSWGSWWSCNSSSNVNARGFRFDYNGYVYPSATEQRAYGQSVRCCQE